MDGQCSKCGHVDRLCTSPEGRSPSFCSTVIYEDSLITANSKYDDPDTHEFAVQAAKQEKACYGYVSGNSGPTFPLKPRIIEIIEFCGRMNYTRVGFAFCGGLHKEAAAVGKVLESHGLEVVSVMCKVGCIDKTRLGLTDNDKIQPGNHESMCNPIGQAAVLNQAQTQLNIMLGLCVGHDSLFLKNCNAMCTVLAVKDRILGHNPLAAIYSNYYQYVSEPGSAEKY